MLDRKLFWTMLPLLAACVALGVLIRPFIPDHRFSLVDLSEIPEGWRQVDWPLLNDQFGPGIAFECLGNGCSTILKVTIRPKMGFCNCATGIADDEELSRVGDALFFPGRYEPAGPGKSIRLQQLDGREQQFRSPDQPDILSAAFASGCDAIAITARGLVEPGQHQQLVRLLDSSGLHRWISSSLRL